MDQDTPLPVDPGKRATEDDLVKKISGPNATWKGALSGTVAGVAGSIAIDIYLIGASRVSDSAARALRRAQQPAGLAAAKLVKAVTGEPLPEERLPLAGMTLHYVFGAAMGLIYGIAAERRPSVTMGTGGAFGLASTVVLDVAAVPAMGLDEAPWETPLIVHGQAAVGHVVFGVATEVTRRVVRRLLG